MVEVSLTLEVSSNLDKLYFKKILTLKITINSFHSRCHKLMSKWALSFTFAYFWNGRGTPHFGPYYFKLHVFIHSPSRPWQLKFLIGLDGRVWSEWESMSLSFSSQLTLQYSSTWLVLGYQVGPTWVPLQHCWTQPICRRVVVNWIHGSWSRGNVWREVLSHTWEIRSSGSCM
jgi:hypothetical protein